MPQDQVNATDAAAPVREGTLEHETRRLNETLTELRDQINSLAGDLYSVLQLDPPTAEDGDASKPPLLVPAVEQIAVLERGARKMSSVVRSIRNRLQLS